MRSKKDKILEMLREDEGYSAFEIAREVKVTEVYVRSTASRAGIQIPTMGERIDALLDERDELLKELGE